MLIGYVRISTDDQLLDLQRDAMAKAGCERVFEDTASGAKADRIGLAALLANLRRGDTISVWIIYRYPAGATHAARYPEPVPVPAEFDGPVDLPR